MGVPKFYRWISERYPKINQIVSDNALLPEFDHLYLDMNGIIHGCTHPNDRDLSDGLSERDMMLGIMHYLDRIITQIVKPKVSVYMAIDGVAPRAKLNQQRSRRFRSAKDLAEATKDMPKDELGNKTDVFDSNCITPGTEFLAKVSDMIQFFIRKKIKEDPQWHNLNVIFSGHDIPGEGEHKIMNHIREMRASPNYQPNTRHCIYGQDADLIMLGLVTHEPHFTILREIVDFNFNFNNANTLKAVKKFTKESDFQLLHLSVVREYLQIEFITNMTTSVNDSNQDEYNLERIIDDFVFMTFLVGNDFLPHMPTLDIGDGAFDLLFSIYKDQRSGWGSGQYLTEPGGEISDPSRLEAFLAAIGAVETEILEQREKDEAVYLKKKRRWDKRDGKEAGPTDAELQLREDGLQNDYLSMIEDLVTAHDPKDFVDGWTPVSPGEKDFKGRYYFEKLNLTPVDKKEHWKLRRSYMEGLRWCLAYYYRGCISWGWFYPYHYGPMLSDLMNIPKMFDEIKFEVGEPLSPFQQLMGCLPPASSALVPRLYRWLMASHESPIIQFYPVDFEVDMNGKKNPWEGVNLLPFIDIQLLKDVIATHCPPSKLSAVERKRNAIGKVYCYRYDATCTDIVESPGKHIGLPDISGSHSSVSLMDEDLGLSKYVFEPRLIPGTKIPYPGFPSLNVMPIASVELLPTGLNCFGSASKYPNTILTMHQMPELPPIEQLAENLLGKSLFVNWPMMHEGKTVALSDETKEIRLVNGKRRVKKFTELLSDRWRADAEVMSQTYLGGNGVPGSGGIQIGEVRVRIKVLPLQGMKTNPSNGSTKKLFGKEEADIPLQLALWHAPAPDPRFVERGPMTLRDRYPEGCNVVLTKGKLRGCFGTVVGVADKKNVGVKVQTFPAEMPFGLAIARSVQESFVSSVDAARILKLHPGVLGKVMGRLQFDQGRYDLGLNLKTPEGMCVVGYTRKKVEPQVAASKAKDESAWAAGDAVLVVGSRSKGADDDKEDERIQWEYTPKAIRLVESYRSKFPQLFAAFKKKPNERKYDANEVFGPNGEAWLPVVREWLDNHESAKVPRSPVTTDSMSYEAAAAVQKAADVRSIALKKKGFPKESLIKVPGSALYREGSTGATDILLSSDLNDNAKPELGDRIVNLCADGVPFGLRGTVIGIHDSATSGSVEVLMDEEFLGGTSLQGHCANFRGKLCLWSNLLRIAPDNSKGVLDKISPQTAGADVAVSETATPGRAKNSKDGHANSATKVPSPSRKLSAPRKATSRTPPRSASRAGSTPGRSSGSTGRGRQGAWREAKGPDEKGNGFKRSKGVPNGLSRWKNKLKSERDRAVAVDQTAADLKKMLGVSSPPTASNASGEATNNLKAILGVNTAKTTTNGDAIATAPEKPSNAAKDLKAMLGVTSAPSEQPVRIQKRPVPPPSSAADKLMQLMANKQPQPGYPQPNRPAGFNFTYVEEGKEPHPPHHVPMQMPQPHGMPPYPNFPQPPPGPTGMPMGMPTMPMSGFVPPPPPPPPPPKFAYGSAPPAQVNGPSTVEFPPLGSTGPPAAEVTPSKTEQNNPKGNSIMVPSAVAARGKRKNS